MFLGSLSNNISRGGLDQFLDSQKLVHETEVHAYRHIYIELLKKGWAKTNIFTQNEIQTIPHIKKQLGRTTPENVVRINENTYYVIEAKSRRTMLNTALKEAKIDYANKINNSDTIKALFITGIAGNENDGYIAVSKYLKNDKWVTIKENNIEVTGILSKEQIKNVLEKNEPCLQDIEISDMAFLEAAETINEILHDNSINKDYRARFISALLLTISIKSDFDLEQETPVLIKNINAYVDSVLHRHNKSEFSRFMHIDEPSSSDNHIKVKNAIVKTTQVLINLNIQAAMKSGKDVLGQFYEAFLKYGNGAKEIGIVLTPRHLTRFVAEVMDIQSNDLVLDPTCGTGGFLVAAFDEVRRKTGENSDEFKRFKKWGLYGTEDQDPVISLALVNMIFRGDGKNNIMEGNCFSKWLNHKSKDGTVTAEFLSRDTPRRIAPITKVMMNPPFPKRRNKKEYLFVDHALKQMNDGGLLFSVLPYSCMIKDGHYDEWRKSFLKNNTLLAVMTLPPDLFQPMASVNTVGIFVKKGIPHNDQRILWLRCIHDGLKIKKKKRLPNVKEQNDLEKIKLILKDHIHDKSKTISNIPKFQKITKLNFELDDVVELCPEVYLDDEPISKNNLKTKIEKTVVEYIAFDFLIDNGAIQ